MRRFGVLAIGILGFMLGVLAMGAVGMVGAQSNAGGAATPAAGAAGSELAGHPVYDDFLAKMATNLGVNDAKTVDQALRTTLKQMVDEREQAHLLTADQATLIKQRIDSSPVPFMLWGGPGSMGMIHGGMMHGGPCDHDGGRWGGGWSQGGMAPGGPKEQGEAKGASATETPTM